MSNQLFSVYRKIESVPAIAVHGSVVTKPHIVELMLDLAGYQGDSSQRLLDPGCGAGAFTLAAAVRLARSSKVKSFGDLAECIVAIEKDEEAANACRSRVVDSLSDAGLSRPLAKRLAERW
jgi:adenine-specific DNA-methyltransferase